MEEDEDEIPEVDDEIKGRVVSMLASSGIKLDAACQWEEEESVHAIQLSVAADDEEEEEEEEDEKGAKGRPGSFKKKAYKGARKTVSMHKFEWTVREIYQNKAKRDIM